MIENIQALPQPKRTLLKQLVEQLSQVPGMSAIVLGGSYASGAHHEGSDMDIGLYYHPEHPFSVDNIQRIAQNAAEGGRATVTGFYEWGAWVNGGAWIHTPQGKVDFLYRNLGQVQRTIDEAWQGISHHDYDQQPAYGFYSVIYLAETQICIPLYDPDALITSLKQNIEVYPPALKKRIIADSLWSAEFTLLHARSFASQGDVYNTAGCFTRATANLTQALFALNEKYFIRDKKVMQVIAGFSLLPPGYVPQISHILSNPGGTAQKLMESVSALTQVWRSVVSLPGTNYASKFEM